MHSQLCLCCFDLSNKECHSKWGKKLFAFKCLFLWPFLFLKPSRVFHQHFLSGPTNLRDLWATTRYYARRFRYKLACPQGRTSARPHIMHASGLPTDSGARSSYHLPPLVPPTTLESQQAILVGRQADKASFVEESRKDTIVKTNRADATSPTYLFIFLRVAPYSPFSRRIPCAVNAFLVPPRLVFLPEGRQGALGTGAGGAEGGGGRVCAARRPQDTARARAGPGELELVAPGQGRGPCGAWWAVAASRPSPCRPGASRNHVPRARLARPVRSPRSPRLDMAPTWVPQVPGAIGRMFRPGTNPTG